MSSASPDPLDDLFSATRSAPCSPDPAGIAPGFVQRIEARVKGAGDEHAWWPWLTPLTAASLGFAAVCLVSLQRMEMEIWSQWMSDAWSLFL